VTRSLAGLAVAATVLAAMPLAAGCSTAPPPAAVAPAGPLRAVAPAGPVSWPFTFTWEGAGADSVVRVRVFDEAERLLHGIEARGASAPAPEALRRLLRPGTTYLWRAARVDANGEESDQSELVAFSVG
jgi:hypothetical protein